jgi:hypothetical protein
VFGAKRANLWRELNRQQRVLAIAAVTALLVAILIFIQGIR